MIEPVVDKSSHQKALRRIEELWDAKPGSREERELDALATLVDAYERRTFPIQALGPLEAIKLRCKQLGWTRRELEPLIGSRARVSEVLSGRRALTLPMIRRITDASPSPLRSGSPNRERHSSGHPDAKANRAGSGIRIRHVAPSNKVLHLTGELASARPPAGERQER